MVVTSSICSNCIHLPSLHPHLITNKPALFRATNRLSEKTTIGTLRNVGVAWVEATQCCHYQKYFYKTWLESVYFVV